MHKEIRYCPKCKIYTMFERCPICGGKTIRKVPPKFSFPDRYGKYRRIIKEKMLKEEGLL